MNSITNFRGDYYFLSNMFPCYIRYHNLWFKCSESIFQAEKQPTPEVLERFTKLDGFQAKAESKLLIKRVDWKLVKYDIMKNIIFEKFKQNPGLLEKLLDTDNSLLIEGNTWGDTDWGVCKGKGKNNLGKILMEVRDYFKTK